MTSSEFEILLIEDTRSDAEMITRALRKGNIRNTILHLQDGKEALDFFSGAGEFINRDTQQKPRIILLDLKMPKVNGIQVLQVLKSNEQTKKIPVVVLTSSRENPDIEQCYALGVNSFVVKPVAFDDFMKVVSNLGVYWMQHNQGPSETI